MARNPRTGFHVCNHTCQPVTCINARSKVILWPKEGSSGVRHSKLTDHPGCTRTCPAAGRQGQPVRDATREDYVRTIADMIKQGHQPATIDELFSKHVPGWKSGPSNWPTLDNDPLTAPSDDRMEVDEDVVAMKDIALPSTGSSAGPSRSTSIGRLGEPTPSVCGSSTIENMVHEYPYGSTTRSTLTPIKLLYVPDPSRAFRSGIDVSSDLGWVRRSLTAEELVAIQGLQPFQRKVKPRVGERSAGTTPMLVTEWLWGMLCLSGHRLDGVKTFEVSYMLWDDFKAVLIDPRDPGSRERWDSIRSQDCIIGGIDYTINTTCVIRILAFQFVLTHRAIA
ncbi:hypothetical protein PAXRUDRAFT_22522 [Paxillus rubicundulus Ve08.2h10]|uniref:Uncharacterized protein n=1 Tax=Paxillus rubicundulus Ve08.2h10 TaxID=930991 RepID=A0A0D0BK11_9AGAM|nr:hypothetical protein PAXRUDRAFT_22522 [Paxillus rubicundulus Ve08.2h10]